MSPEDASEKVRALDGAPKASLVGWQVITEPDTSDAEAWTVWADLPPGLVHEDRTLYLRSDASGEVIVSGIAGLRESRILMTVAGCQLSARLSVDL